MMSRVDFYILPDGTSVDRFACGIAAKAWSQGNTVYIHTQSGERAKHMDKLLWTYRDISFIPHEFVQDVSEQSAPVLIGSDENSANADVIVNLHDEVPGFVQKFERIVEIVGGDEQTKQLARQRYRHYKAADYEIHDHKLGDLSSDE